MTLELDAHLVVDRADGFRLDAELHIAEGETAALLGPNGAGKSSTVAALAGLVPLVAGHVRLGGRVLEEPSSGAWVPPERRRVGVAFQRYLLFEHMTALDNVAFAIAARGGGLRAARRSAERWLEELGVWDLRWRRPRQLSGGQAQRVSVARALATEPDLLLLDEPLAALDVSTRASVRRTLAHTLDGLAIPKLLVTHEPSEAFLMADRIHIIEQGRIAQVGTSDELRRAPATPFAADVAGVNLVEAVSSAGVLRTVDTGHLVHSATAVDDGPVLITIRPNAVALHETRPEGSPRNTWEAPVEAVERLGATYRVLLGQPLPLVAEVTPGSIADLDLAVGRVVWASLKATEVAVTPR